MHRIRQKNLINEEIIRNLKEREQKQEKEKWDAITTVEWNWHKSCHKHRDYFCNPLPLIEDAQDLIDTDCGCVARSVRGIYRSRHDDSFCATVFVITDEQTARKAGYGSSSRQHSINTGHVDWVTTTLQTRIDYRPILNRQETDGIWASDHERINRYPCPICGSLDVLPHAIAFVPIRANLPHNPPITHFEIVGLLGVCTCAAKSGTENIFRDEYGEVRIPLRLLLRCYADRIFPIIRQEGTTQSEDTRSVGYNPYYVNTANFVLAEDLHKTFIHKCHPGDNSKTTYHVRSTK